LLDAIADPNLPTSAHIVTAAVFALWIVVGTSPPYQRGSFPDYQRCVEAARGQVDTLQQIERDSVR
jgi:hypothetical protein